MTSFEAGRREFFFVTGSGSFRLLKHAFEKKYIISRRRRIFPINSINRFFTWPFIPFLEDLEPEIFTACVAAKSRDCRIGYAVEKRSIMLPLCPRVYLVMHRWKICPGPTQIRSRTLSFLSTDLRLLQCEEDDCGKIAARRSIKQQYLWRRFWFAVLNKGGILDRLWDTNPKLIDISSSMAVDITNVCNSSSCNINQIFKFFLVFLFFLKKFVLFPLWSASRVINKNNIFNIFIGIAT